MSGARRFYSLNRESLKITLLKPSNSLYSYALHHCAEHIHRHNNIYDLSCDRKALKEKALGLKNDKENN